MKEKLVFIINGSGGVGKDTFANMVSTIYEGKVDNFSSIDRIKEAAVMLGWTGEKGEEDRKFLSDIKKLSSEYNDMPFRSMKKRYDYFLEAGYEVLFLHIREPEEIERAKREFNAKTILIKRDSVKQIKSNSSDRDVENYRYDIVINNNGDLMDLVKTVKKFIFDMVNDRLKDSYGGF